LYGGDWKDGEMHGKGVYWTASNHNLYDGEWQHNRKHGSGLMLYGNTKERYNGEWSDDMKHGFASFTDANGDVFEGSWSKGKKHGKVFLYLANGDIFETQFDNDNEVKYARKKSWKQRGQEKQFGECVLENGELYSGDLANGVPDGAGAILYKNGDRFEGCWRKGKKFGPGYYYHKDGSKEQMFYGDDYYHITGSSLDDVEFQKMKREREEKEAKEPKSEVKSAPKSQAELEKGIKQFQKLAKNHGFNAKITPVQSSEQWRDIMKTMEKGFCFDEN
jgi:hypothetical protein